MKTCKDCTYYHNGRCFRYPPKMMIYTDRPDENPYVHSVYTEVYTEDPACGEFYPSEKEEK